MTKIPTIKPNNEEDTSRFMHAEEWTKTWHNPQFDVRIMRAFYIEHAFPRHSHEYYVICLIKRGLQSFTHKGTKHFTPADGLIVINPDVVHTGEAADANGFEMVCLYPTIAHMQQAAFELTGRRQALPFFAEVRIDHPWTIKNILAMHHALEQKSNPLEAESRFVWTLAQLIKHYADVRYTEQPLGHERKAVRQARRYIDTHYDQGVNLTQLADHVALSPYYLLRVFRAEVGMPPHTYQDSVRINHAQRLIKSGKSMAEVAFEVGYSSQSHLTNRFKQIIGVTPGQYAHQLR
ncbi:MAG: AraC family transcriptional regulator [Anaerolineae bacterium]|nr:AraC family transcriptional regulator [Anaerolineae bacterium]